MAEVLVVSLVNWQVDGGHIKSLFALIPDGIFLNIPSGILSYIKFGVELPDPPVSQLNWRG